MELLVKYFLGDLMKNNIKPADYYIAVPWDVTDDAEAETVCHRLVHHHDLPGLDIGFLDQIFEGTLLQSG